MLLLFDSWRLRVSWCSCLREWYPIWSLSPQHRPKAVFSRRVLTGRKNLLQFVVSGDLRVRVSTPFLERTWLVPRMLALKNSVVFSTRVWRRLFSLPKGEKDGRLWEGVETLFLRHADFGPWVFSETICFVLKLFVFGREVHHVAKSRPGSVGRDALMIPPA